MGENHSSRIDSEIVLSVKNLRAAASPHPEGISFDLHAGEILGIAGLVGAGRTEVMRAIFGADTAVSGSISLNDHEHRYSAPRQAIADGLAFVTEDRRDEGVILSMPITSNISLANLKAVSRAGIIDRHREDELATRLGQDLRLKYGRLQDTVSTLSGGNQQKVVLAKWLARNPSILLLDEPTRGVDVGAKSEIYELLRQLARDGKSLIIVSSELYELMALCDRIVVMANHAITGELTRDEFSEEQLLTYAYKTGPRT
ncbi:ATP-binding cassette domain-containing protein (plasmid) [Paracoccus sp. SCSIO 75233]|nr:ATP-binding cassette domain-containing protein [Paracoccus sp. SCSIO 75233]WBU55342.1 ATP-binding cassette domain-containing protein [Paracoccus sp. SCSIO 75233]